jgi:hypothetical protein
VASTNLSLLSPLADSQLLVTLSSYYSLQSFNNLLRLFRILVLFRNTVRLAFHFRKYTSLNLMFPTDPSKTSRVHFTSSNITCCPCNCRLLCFHNSNFHATCFESSNSRLLCLGQKPLDIYPGKGPFSFVSFSLSFPNLIAAKPVL